MEVAARCVGWGRDIACVAKLRAGQLEYGPTLSLVSAPIFGRHFVDHNLRAGPPLLGMPRAGLAELGQRHGLKSMSSSRAPLGRMLQGVRIPGID